MHQTNCTIQPGAQSGVWKSASQAVPTSEFIILWWRGKNFFYHWPFFPAKCSWQVSSLQDASECEIFWGTAKTAVSWQSCFRIWIPRTKTINPFDHYGLQCVPYDHRLWCSRVEIETTKDWGGLIGEDRTEKREWLKSGSGRKSGSDSFVTFVPHHTPLVLPRFPKSAPSSSHDRRIVPTVVHSSSTRERARPSILFWARRQNDDTVVHTPRRGSMLGIRSVVRQPAGWACPWIFSRRHTLSVSFVLTHTSTCTMPTSKDI